MNAMNRWASHAAALIVLSSLFLMPAAQADDMKNAYTVHNLVSDGTIPADHMDGNLVNPWGVAFNPNGFVWVADNGTGVSTLYDGHGVANALVVTIPGGNPTGITFNNSPDFVVSKSGVSGPAAFIFVTESGVISGWNPTVDLMNAIPMPDNPPSTGALYKGLAVAANGTDHFLYATDFHNGRIDVLDKNFEPVTLPPGAFADPRIPSGFAPFGIRNINGRLFVTYALRDADAVDDVHGPGLGFVDVFDANGMLIRHLIARGRLNAPWGLALAPADFGEFGNSLLVGNFGDGTINAYDPERGNFRGTLRLPNRHPLVIDGLWGISFGNGTKEQPTNVLFFAAGPNDESNGVYGRIEAVPFVDDDD